MQSMSIRYYLMRWSIQSQSFVIITSSLPTGPPSMSSTGNPGFGATDRLTGFLELVYLLKKLTFFSWISSTSKQFFMPFNLNAVVLSYFHDFQNLEWVFSNYFLNSTDFNFLYTLKYKLVDLSEHWWSLFSFLEMNLFDSFRSHFLSDETLELRI